MVDEEPAGLAELQAMLDGCGYSLLTAASGVAAKLIVEQRAADISAILLELALPDIGGIELLRWLKAQASLGDAEVVVQSTELGPEAVRRGLDFGAYYYLAKPLEASQVRAIIKAAVSACVLRRSLAAQVDAIEDAFGLLTEGSFEVRTLREAELLSAHPGSAMEDRDFGVAILEL